jgi:hypothetical protein
VTIIRLNWNQVYAAGSEDMDTLTFNAPILLRHLTYSEARKEPVLEVQLAKVLEGLEMEMGQVRRFLLDSYPLPYRILKVY